MERGIEMARPFAGQVHRAQSVLKPGVLGRGEDPPRALQLMDAAQALQPRGIHQVLLRGLTRDAARPALRDAKVSRSEEHTSELQSPCNLVCRLLLEKKKKKIIRSSG